MILIKDAELDDLPLIMELAKKNYISTVGIEESQREGFVTIHYSLTQLSKLNVPIPHTIAKDGDMLVAYAITALPSKKIIKGQLSSLLIRLREVEDYVIMGQICIAKEYRGQGIFRSMYQWMSKKLSQKYNRIITEVSSENKRSLHAHLAIGFEVIMKRDKWIIVSLEISK